MGTSIELSRKSEISLRTKTLEDFYPDASTITSLNDFNAVRLENLAAELFRERVYTLMVNLLKTETWKYVDTIKTNCLNCGAVTSTRQLKEIEQFYNEGAVTCPVCGNDSVLTEQVRAFDDLADFYKWISEELGVTKRTIMMRKEYFDRTERLGVDEPTAFAGLVKWGIAWMKMARTLEYSVQKGAINADEATNIIRGYDAIPDKSTVIRFTNTMSEKDEFELVANPYSPDFFLNITSPTGETKASYYFLAIPIQQEIQVNSVDFWQSNFGLMIARRFGIHAPITYDKPLEYVPGFNYYELSAARAIMVEPVRKIVRYLFRHTSYIVDNKDVGVSKEEVSNFVHAKSEEGAWLSIETLVSSMMNASKRFDWKDIGGVGNRLKAIFTKDEPNS